MAGCEPVDKYAQASQQQGLAVVFTFLALADRTDVGAEGVGVASSWKRAMVWCSMVDSLRFMSFPVICYSMRHLAQ